MYTIIPCSYRHHISPHSFVTGIKSCTRIIFYTILSFCHFSPLTKYIFFRESAARHKKGTLSSFNSVPTNQTQSDSQVTITSLTRWQPGPDQLAEPFLTLLQRRLAAKQSKAERETDTIATKLLREANTKLAASRKHRTGRTNAAAAANYTYSAAGSFSSGGRTRHADD